MTKSHLLILKLVLISIITIGCSTIPPVVEQFTVNHDRIEEGDAATLTWNVKGSDEISISGIGANLTESGSRTVQLYTTSTFKLIAKKGKEVIERELQVTVYPKKVEPEKPKTVPIVEEKSTKATAYASGIVNAENVKKEDEPELYINLIDAKTNSNKVKLYCSIKDKYGNLVANLAPPYNSAFIDNWRSLAEEYNGKKVEIKEFKVEEVREDIAPPFSTSFVLDYSGSMENDFQFVDRAMKNATNYIRPGKDDFQVVQFDHRVISSVPLSGNKNDISKIITFNNLAGGTAFYTASQIGIEELTAKSNKEKVAILFTDGGDNASLLNANDVIAKARETGTKVFIIGFSRPWGGFSTETLSAMAEQTGGKAYFPKSAKEIDDIFQEIYRLMKVYYVVSYTTEEDKSSVVRNVNLKYNFPYFDKQLSANKNYYTQPQRINEDRIVAIAYFGTSKSDIDQEYERIIEDVAKFLKDNPSKQIRVLGHTDTKGSDVLNNSLSKKRANIVANKLKKYGVKNKQIQKIEGKGKTAPICPNETSDYDRQANRRVEIVLI